MLNIIHKEKAINNWNCSKFGKSKVNHDALVQVDVVMENSIEHIEWCQQNSDQEEWSIPSKWKYGKRKQLKNIIGVLGNSQTNIYCNKVNKQLGKIQKTGRILLCVCVCVCVCVFHTHLSPDLNRATLICKGWWPDTLLPPSKQTHRRNPYVLYSPILGACLEAGVHFT